MAKNLIFLDVTDDFGEVLEQNNLAGSHSEPYFHEAFGRSVTDERERKVGRVANLTAYDWYNEDET
jgi:hypothetical protein